MTELNRSISRSPPSARRGKTSSCGACCKIRKRAIFVDVGAHHPFRFSNTQFFYQRGWRGINIEADPAAHALFQEYRPEDINVSCMVSDEEKTYDFDIYNEPALNSGVAARREHVGTNYFVKETLSLPARRLSSILDDYVPAGTEIDFLSVDVEGFDLNVLRSNDWSKHKPRFVVVEIASSTSPPQRATRCMNSWTRRATRCAPSSTSPPSICAAPAESPSRNAFEMTVMGWMSGADRDSTGLRDLGRRHDVDPDHPATA